MKKRIIILFTFLFFTNCGFTPIYSNKNLDFNFKNIVTTKVDPLNSKLKKKLQIFSNEDSEKSITLKVGVQKKINTLAKNSKGDPSRYEMIINVNLDAIYNNNQNVKKSFQERFNYKSSINKFELNQYQKEIEELLINKNIENIIVYLSKL